MREEREAPPPPPLRCVAPRATFSYLPPIYLQPQTLKAPPRPAAGRRERERGRERQSFAAEDGFLRRNPFPFFFSFPPFFIPFPTATPCAARRPRTAAPRGLQATSISPRAARACRRLCPGPPMPLLLLLLLPLLPWSPRNERGLCPFCTPRGYGWRHQDKCAGSRKTAPYFSSERSRDGRRATSCAHSIHLFLLPRKIEKQQQLQTTQKSQKQHKSKRAPLQRTLL